jgi:hypothetical protein
MAMPQPYHSVIFSHIDVKVDALCLMVDPPFAATYQPGMARIQTAKADFSRHLKNSHGEKVWHDSDSRLKQGGAVRANGHAGANTGIRRAGKARQDG